MSNPTQLVIDEGDFNLYIGPMYSGKSTTMLAAVNKLIKCQAGRKKKAILVKLSSDTRDSSDVAVTTHDGNQLRRSTDGSIWVERFTLQRFLFESFDGYDIICIEEIHLEVLAESKKMLVFSESKSLVDQVCDKIESLVYEKGKRVHVTANDIWNDMTLVQVSHQLMKLGKVHVLRAKCDICGKDESATISRNKATTESILSPGRSEQWMAICPRCNKNGALMSVSANA